MPSTKASSGARGVAGSCPIISVYYAYLLRSHGIRHLHCRQNVIALWQTADSISRSADAHAVAHTPFRWPGRRTKMRFMRTAYARPRTEMHPTTFAVGQPVPREAVRIVIRHPIRRSIAGTAVEESMKVYVVSLAVPREADLRPQVLDAARIAIVLENIRLGVRPFTPAIGGFVVDVERRAEVICPRARGQ